MADNEMHLVCRCGANLKLAKRLPHWYGTADIAKRLDGFLEAHTFCGGRFNDSFRLEYQHPVTPAHEGDRQVLVDSATILAFMRASALQLNSHTGWGVTRLWIDGELELVWDGCYPPRLTDRARAAFLEALERHARGEELIK